MPLLLKSYTNEVKTRQIRIGTETKVHKEKQFLHVRVVCTCVKGSNRVRWLSPSHFSSLSVDVPARDQLRNGLAAKQETKTKNGGASLCDGGVR